MAGGSFDSAWLKWGWAVVHAQALQAEITTFFANVDRESLYATRTEYDPKRHCVIQRIAIVEPLPAVWGLMLGDTAANFRAALDHLMYAIASRGRVALTDDELARVYFPIAATKVDFRERFRSRTKKGKPTKNVLRGVLPADKAILARYQPCAVGGKARHHCFTPLPDLNAHDKHRRIQPILVTPDTGRVDYGPPEDCEITRLPTRSPRLALDLDAEVHRIYVRKTGPNPDIYMKAHLKIQPALNQQFWLGEWLKVTTLHIRDLLSEFAKPPLELATIKEKAHAASQPRG